MVIENSNKEADMSGKITRRNLLTLGMAGFLNLAIESTKSSAATVLSNGIDISWLPSYEAAGGKFLSSASKPIDAFALLKQSGLKVVRVRVFVNPNERNGQLSDAIALATRAKDAGLDFCLDFHFSDTWADPGHQSIPSGWSSTNFDTLSSQLKAYTISTLNEFKTRNLPMAYVQLGNEIAGGMLWPLGKINGNDATSWRNFTKLYSSAVSGLKSVYPLAKNIIHLELGGQATTINWWLSSANQYGLTGYDVVGLSYYPQWHGTIEQLTASLKMVAETYKKPVLIAETAYPNTPYTFGGDVIDSVKGTVSGYPASPSGQVSYIRKLQSVLKALKYTNGVGVWWWEGLATQVTSKGVVVWNKGMTNSALVNTKGKALSALSNMKV
jgi:arabinogalactan endo-1,4-beta-galactosidase